MKSPLSKVLIIFLVTLLCVYISLPSQFPIKLNLGKYSFEKTFNRGSLDIELGKFSFKRSLSLALGLDLAGGSHLVFEADTSKVSGQEKADALASLREIIERRVNLFGVSEPNIQISSFENKSRVIVELPGVNDPKDAVSLIGQTAQLVFGEMKEVKEENTNNELPFTFTDLTGADLKRASVAFDSNTGKPSVSLEFTPEGARKFEELTERNVGKMLPIFLDNQPVSAPVVKEKIAGGTAQITGDFTLDEAKNLAIQLNAGALPLPVKLVEQRTVGATLGSESIQKSIRAGLVGLLMVVLFMTLSYGFLGFIASLALFVFAVISLALYKLIPVVLTLPGIAGFLLSVGMAVDSNILIFERFKEERLRRPLREALEVSFGRAWDSIRDANIATLTTAFVLANPFDWGFLHTSGPVRGFAITLALGVGLSMFTGIVVSRNLLRVFVKEKKQND
jgi:preprotein translocase subunit SecD